MALSPLCKDDGTVNWGAALEHACFAVAFYGKGLDKAVVPCIKEVGDYKELARRVLPDDWSANADATPGYVMYEHDGAHWIDVQGTATVTQWAGDILGAVPTPLLGNVAGFFHAYFGAMAGRLRTAYYAATSNEKGLPVNVCGHSLGGAVAWCLGALLKQDAESRKVRVLTLGSPRTTKGPYLGKALDCANNVYTFGDIVGHVAPNTPLAIVKWRVQGNVKVVAKDGTLKKDDANAGELSAELIRKASIETHLAGTYVNALLKLFDGGKVGALPKDSRLVAKCGGWIEDDKAPARAPEPPDVGPDRFDKIIKSNLAGGGTGMATQKVVFIFNDGGAGWSETFYVTGRDADPDATVAVAQALAVERARSLAKPNAEGIPKLEAIRISNVDVPRQSGLFPAAPEVGQMQANNPTGMCGTRTHVWSLYSAMKAQRSKHSFRGAPGAWLEGDIGERRTGKINGTLAKAMDSFSAMLKGKRLPNVVWSIKSRTFSRLPNTNGVLSVNRDPTTGQWLVTIPSIVTALVPPVKILIRGVRGQGLKGLNGPALVVGTTDNPGEYLLNKMPCQNCQIKWKNHGEVLILSAVAYPLITEMLHTGYGQRKTGGAFFVRRGRRLCRACP